jgi:iron complex outermembrane receptor protein
MTQKIRAAFSLFPCTLLAFAPLAGRAQTTTVLDLPAQSLAESLKALGAKTHTNVMVAPSLVDGRQAPALKAALSMRDALGRLLDGTGLEYVFVDEQTIVIRQKLPGSGTEHQNRAARQTALTSRAEAQSSPDRVASASEPATQAHSPVAENGALLEEIIVTGSRLKRVVGEDAAPVTVFDSDRIQQLGVSTVSDVLNYLPQQPYTDLADLKNVGGARFADLRGLGIDTTLILIDGRRTVPSGASVQFNAFDLNTVPLAAVDRVEVLTDSASAVYGADAIGGVINIILKKKIDRPSVDLQYGAADGGASERHVSVAGGYSTDTFHSSLVADFFRRGYLTGDHRPLFANQDYTAFGGLDYRAPFTNPANIVSLSGENLPGLSAPAAVVPAGSSGVGLTPEDFAATAGLTNLDSLSRFASAIPRADRRSIAGSAELDIGQNLSMFADVLYAKRKNTSQGSPPLAVGVVPGTSPFNPFGVDVLAEYSVSAAGLTTLETDSELYRVTAGLRGKVGSWDWELSTVRTDEQGSSWVSNDVDANKVNAALSATDPAQFLNVFQDGPGGSPALIRSLIATPVVSRSSSEGTMANAFLRGTLFAAPGGEVEAVVGADWRRENSEYTSGIAAARTLEALFTEVHVPLISPDMQVPGARRLTLTAAGRWDHYSDFGNTVNPQLGLAWQTSPQLLVRASYGTSFRAPSLYELFEPPQSFPFTVTDPRRGNEVSNISWSVGGNAALQPVEGKSFTGGLVLTPEALPDVRVSTSYWRVRMSNRVSGLPLQQIINFESLFPERVMRAAPTPADIAAGRPGALTSVDSSYVNFGLLRANGIDFGFEDRIRTAYGELSPALSATWVGTYRAENLPGQPATNRVGLANSNGTIARWRINGTLSWARAAWTFSTTLRYTPAYRDADFFTTEAIDHTLPSQTLVDVQGSLDFGSLPLAEHTPVFAGVKLSAGVMNLFDREPVFAQIGGSGGFDAAVGDIRQRFIYARLSKNF